MNTLTSISGINEENVKTAFKSPSQNKHHNQSRFFYTVGLFNFLLEESIKVENLYEFTVNSVPSAPEWCSGVTSIRGDIMPVVNMHVFLKTGIRITSRKKKLIMLKHKNHAPIVFEIDKLPEVIFPHHYTTMKAPDKAPLWLKKVLINKNNTLYQINHSQLLEQLKNSQI